MADDDRRVIDLWQNQTAKGFRMSQKEMEMKVQALDARVRRRTVDLILLAALIFLLSIHPFVHEPALLVRLGMVGRMIAFAFFAFQAYRNQSRIAPAPTMAAPSMEYLRGELQRQADYYRGKPLLSRILLWVLAQLFCYFGFALAYPETIVMIPFDIVLFAVIVTVVILLNLRAARKYQRLIEELDR